MRNYAPAEPGSKATPRRINAAADRLTTHVLRALLALTTLALAVAAAVHAAGGRIAAMTFVIAYLVWVLSEARITAGTPSKSAAENRTLVPYAAARIATAFAAAYSAPVTSVAAVSLVLVGFFLAGVALRAWAIRELGAQYSHRVIGISASGLVYSGPYRVLRHPAYAGMLLANAGFVGYFASPAGLVALSVLAVAIRWRINVEEGVLLRSPEYREFAATRSRILPGVW